MNIVEIINSHPSTISDKKAIIDDRSGSNLTYQQLNIQSAQMAQLFINSGLRAGDGVLVFVPMTAKLYVILLALFRLKLVAIFIDPHAGLKYIENCCALYPPKAFIADSKVQLLGFFSKAIRKIPIKFCLDLSLPFCIHLSKYMLLNPNHKIEPCDGRETALITFTSGSTAAPKVIVRTHEFLLAQHKILNKTLSLQPDSVVMVSLPVFLLSHLGAGLTSFIPNANLAKPGRIDPGPVVKQLQAGLVNSIIGPPAFIEQIIRFCEKKQIIISGMKNVYTGGAPVFPVLLDRIKAIMPESVITAVYGSSEAEPIAHIDLDQISFDDIYSMQTGSGLLTGKPVNDIDIRIIPHFNAQPVGPFSATHFASLSLSPGEKGEVVVHGRHVLTGYLNGRGDTETKFKVDGNTWHRTGDSGYVDHQGRLWLLGRSSTVIKHKDNLYYPFTVESALSWNKLITRSALLGVGDTILLFVETVGKIDVKKTEAELQKILSWIPITKFIFLKKIPVDKRHNSKVDYTALKNCAACVCIKFL